jgi:UDP-3-O-[3-hydroxymyristoyl] glucosamine N-acyltransferase LpxD
LDLKSFAAEFLKTDIESRVEYTGMADSTRPCTISFLEKPKFAKRVNANDNISAVIVRERDAHLLDGRIEAVISDNPKAALFSLHNAYCKDHLKYGENKIAESAKIHPTACIAPEGVAVGENVVIGPNTVILSGVEIGENTRIGPGCVIGEDGFHVFEDLEGIKRIVIHDGMVRIGKNVDIQALSAVDKGFMGRDTVIGDECKLDDYVHIAHRVHLGCGVVMAGGSDVAGSVNIGNNVWIGPRALVSNRLNIGDNARILLGSVVIRNVRENDEVSGNFAIRHDLHLMADAKDLFEG